MKSIVCCLVLLFTCSACQRGYRYTDIDPKTVPLGKPRDTGTEMKELVLAKLLAKVQKPDPPEIRRAAAMRNPTCEGMKRMNVRVVRHGRLGTPWGHYTAVTTSESNWNKDPAPTDRRPRDIPIPEIVIYDYWLYAIGDAPCIGTTAVIAQAEGCGVALQYYLENAGTTNEKRYHRVYYLEGNPDKFVFIHKYPYDPSARQIAVISVGTFVDAEEDPVTHRFKNWKGKAPGEDPDIQVLNEETDTVFQLIREEVNIQRVLHDIS